MTFNNTADSLIRHGLARRVDAAEGLDLLQQARDQRLVQFGENVRQRVNFICNCCGCCCEALIAARRFGHLHPVHTTNFLPEVDPDALHRLRQVRRGLPGGGDDAGLGQRPGQAEAQAGAARRRTSASAAASACPPARSASSL